MMEPFDNILDNPQRYHIESIIRFEINKRFLANNIRKRLEINNKDKKARKLVYGIINEIKEEFQEKIKYLYKLDILISIRDNGYVLDYIKLNEVDYIDYTQDKKYIDMSNTLHDRIKYIYKFMMYAYEYGYGKKLNEVSEDEIYRKACIESSKVISMQNQFPICEFYDDFPQNTISVTVFGKEAIDKFNEYGINILKLMDKHQKIISKYIQY